MRGLPEMRPARSFQLGPEYAGQTHGANVSGWLSRMLGLMPALRAATAAVAMLLVVAVAGDVLTNDDNGNREQSAFTTSITSTPCCVDNFYTPTALPTNVPSDSLMMESEAPTEPQSEANTAAAAGAAEQEEAPPSEAAAKETTEV